MAEAEAAVGGGDYGPISPFSISVWIFCFGDRKYEFLRRKQKAQTLQFCAIFALCAQTAQDYVHKLRLVPSIKREVLHCAAYKATLINYSSNSIIIPMGSPWGRPPVSHIKLTRRIRLKHLWPHLCLCIRYLTIHEQMSCGPTFLWSCIDIRAAQLNTSAGTISIEQWLLSTMMSELALGCPGTTYICTYVWNKYSQSCEPSFF